MRIWEIPNDGLKKNMTEAVLELYGHSRRVGIIEWHPTANNILFSSGYDYKVSNHQIQPPKVKMLDLDVANHSFWDSGMVVSDKSWRFHILWSVM